jgi:hypothetical protein
MAKYSFVLAFFLGVFTTLGMAEPNPGPAEQKNWPVYYCQAESYFTGNWYYWYSEDLNYARYMALNACIRDNGYTCTVGCRIW